MFVFPLIQPISNHNSLSLASVCPHLLEKKNSVKLYIFQNSTPDQLIIFHHFEDLRGLCPAGHPRGQDQLQQLNHSCHRHLGGRKSLEQYPEVIINHRV